MASWGDIAIGGHRPTVRYPTRSAVLGLIAASLGYARDDDRSHGALDLGSGIAVRVDRDGHVITDYHTVQVPPLRRGYPYRTRREEMDRPRDDVDTLLSQREYVADAAYTILLWKRNDSGPTIEEMLTALAAPVFPLYLGRRSCPLGVPLDARGLKATTVDEAFANTPPSPWLSYAGGHRDHSAGFLDADANFAGKRLQSIEARDVPLSRARRAFATRRVDHVQVPSGRTA